MATDAKPDEVEKIAKQGGFKAVDVKTPTVVVPAVNVPLALILLDVMFWSTINIPKDPVLLELILPEAVTLVRILVDTSPPSKIIYSVTLPVPSSQKNCISPLS